jgi:NRPS condensation-like uncharacterized protein
MEAQALLRKCNDLNVHLWIDDGALKFKAPKGAMSTDLVAKIKEQKDALISILATQEQASTAPPEGNDQIKSRARLLIKAVWDNYEERRIDVAMANLPHIVVRIDKPIHADALKAAATKMAERNRSLVSNIVVQNGFLLLEKTTTPVSIEFYVAEGTSNDQREVAAMKAAYELVWREFNLDAGLLIRIFAIAVSDSDTILGLVIHHAICDGFSVGIALSELLTIYSGILANNTKPLPREEVDYFDYLISMNKWLESPAAKEHLDFWTNTLSRTPITNLLPDTQNTTADAHLNLNGEETIAFSSATLERLKQSSAKLKTTVFTLMLAAQQVASWCMTNQYDQVAVVITAGRTPATLRVIGNFASEIAYCVSLMGNPSLSEVVERLKNAMTQAERRQSIPFDAIRDQLQQREVNFYAPIVNYMPNVGYTPTPGMFRLRFPRKNVWTQFRGHGVMYREYPDGIEGTLIYRKGIDSNETVAELLKLLKHVVDTLTTKPEIPIEQLRR